MYKYNEQNRVGMYKKLKRQTVTVFVNERHERVMILVKLLHKYCDQNRRKNRKGRQLRELTSERDKMSNNS